LRLPSQAALLARAGDRVEIAPGTYTDCAVWTAPRLTIVAPQGDVTITGPVCMDKGLFVVMSNDVHISGLTFEGARDTEHNGAGIRASGNNLRVTRSRFLNNENGILAGGAPDSTLVVTDSTFRGNGSCEGLCAHGIYAGAPIALLRVARCVFIDTQVGHHVKSRARTTVVEDSWIEDGASGTASYLIDIPDGGNVLIQHNVMQKGRLADNASTAISLGEGSNSNPSQVVIVRDNTFTSDLPDPTLFVRNATGTPVQMSGNHLIGRVTAVAGLGTVAP
jgi:hypothetical protein